MAPEDPKETSKGPVASYPAIEKLIESEDFTQINQTFTKAYQELERLAKEGGFGKSGEAKKAMQAIQQVIDLLRELLQLKHKVQDNLKAGEGSKA